MNQKELAAEALNLAKAQLESDPEFAQILSTQLQSIEQITRFTNFLAWARKNLKYSDADGATAMSQQREAKLKALYEQNTAHLTERDEHAKAVSERSWQVMTENFAVIRVPDNKQLSWNENVERGAPSAIEILKELYSGITDDLALVNPKEYLARLFHKYDGETMRYQYGTDEDGEAKMAVFQLKAEPKV